MNCPGYEITARSYISSEREQLVEFHNSRIHVGANLDDLVVIVESTQPGVFVCKSEPVLAVNVDSLQLYTSLVAVHDKILDHQLQGHCPGLGERSGAVLELLC